jgi:tetratricopeptide (TPR) repeat protein
MTATKASYSLIAIDDEAHAAAERGFALGTSPGRRGRVYLRRDFDISSFGVNAFFQGERGEEVIGEHDELGPGTNRHEELYIVLTGSCTFTVEGETVEAPRGTALFVGDPAVKRGAIANEDDTTVIVVGGRPGKAFRISAAEAMGDFFRLYRAGDYAAALEACRSALETHDGNPLVLYNIACMQSLLGRSEEALAALAEALPAWPRFKELAATDEDLDAVREDPRFQELVA